MSQSIEPNMQKAADMLWQAEQTLTPCPPIRDLFDTTLTVEQAYQIQNINTQRRLSQGERIVGRKIGLTSTAVQQQLGVDQPDFGNLYANMVLMEGEQISLNTLIQPKAEVELAVVLGKDLPYEDTTLMDLMAAIDHVLVVVEIVDSRVTNWNIRIEDTVADNASSALVMLGQHPYKLNEIDLITAPMTLTANGKQVSQGVGANCLGNPLIAARWLAQTMAKMGTPMRASELILTGALGPMATVTEPIEFVAQVAQSSKLHVPFV